KKKEASQFMTFSALKKDVKSHIEELETLNINPEVVYPKTLGLREFIHLFFPSNVSLLLVDICQSETTCLLIQEGKLVETRSLPLGFEPLHEEEQEHLKLFA